MTRTTSILFFITISIFLHSSNVYGFKYTGDDNQGRNNYERINSVENYLRGLSKNINELKRDLKSEFKSNLKNQLNQSKTNQSSNNIEKKVADLESELEKVKILLSEFNRLKETIKKMEEKNKLKDEKVDALETSVKSLRAIIDSQYK